MQCSGKQYKLQENFMTQSTFFSTMSCCFITSLLTACGGGGSSSNEQPLTQEQQDVATLRSIITSNNLTGDPAQGRTLPSITDPLAQLGMKLFFSKILGGINDTACASCHHPFLGGGDDLSLPIGVEAVNPNHLGPGREHSPVGHEFDGGPTVPRNSPTIFNIALYDTSMFFDGRVEVLDTSNNPGGEGSLIKTPDTLPGVADVAALNLVQAQALFPVTSQEEMRAQFMAGALKNDILRDALVERIVNQTIPNTWLNEFQAAFNSNDDAAILITYHNVAIALAEYQRSQIFTDTPWRDFVQGENNALTPNEKRGAVLFFTPVANGGAGCSSCHSGDFFTDEEFHVLAVPQIGRGKNNGPIGDDDFGRSRTSLQSVDRYAFRTPNLLNITKTGPYGHSGAYPSLRDMVVHHLDPEQAIANYDFNLTDLDPGIQKDNAEANTRLALAQLQSLRASGNSLLVDTDLTETEINQLLDFLTALTDSCVRDNACLSQWIPSGIDPDSMRLIPLNL
jgi:cytochrome c peroxidase